MGIEQTYFHKMSVSRAGSGDSWDGDSTLTYAPVPLLQLITCAFSQSNRNTANASQTTAANTITYNPKIFCDPSLDIRAGDRITVNYGTRVIGTFQASEPYIYDSHQEIPLMKVGAA